MKFHYAGSRKNFKDDVAAAGMKAKQSGIRAECKGSNFYAVVAWRHNVPQYAFRGSLSGESELDIDGKIELVGTEWKWYDYLFSVLAHILIIPFLILTFIPGDSNAGAGMWIPSPFISKKSQIKRLRSYMVCSLKCDEIT